MTIDDAIRQAEARYAAREATRSARLAEIAALDAEAAALGRTAAWAVGNATFHAERCIGRDGLFRYWMTRARAILADYRGLNNGD